MTASEGNAIVLGLDSYGLRQTAVELDATTLLDDPNWKLTLQDAAVNPESKFIVSLDGVSGSSTYSQIMGAVQRGMTPAASNFDWEMGILYQAGRIGEAIFVRGGVQVPNPF